MSLKASVKKAVRKLDAKTCLLVRQLAVHVAKGGIYGWWDDAEDAIADFPAKKLAKLEASPNWDAIFAAIQQLIEAISEGKEE